MADESAVPLPEVLAAEANATMLWRMWTVLEAFPPTQVLMVVGRMGMDALLDRAVIAFLSFLTGAAALLLVQVLVLWKMWGNAQPSPPPEFPASSDVRMPQVLKSRLDEDIQSKKEDGTWFNFFLQFMFSELQDSLAVRRFLTRKVQTEFEEILRSRSGILVDELFLRDFNLGDNFPVFTGISVDKSDVVKDVIQTLDIRGRILYDGGFQIAVDAALPFGRVAFVSVQVQKLRGLIRFRFTRHPFSHWCMSFYEEPEIELDVTAQLDGRPMPKLKGIFVNQIRRIIRKKHTLPMYKMRFKPFFPPRADQERGHKHRMRVGGTDVGQGIFEVTVKGASRLRFIPKGAYFYCTVSVDELPWKQKVAEERKKREIITVELVKNSADQSLGMTVKDELLPDRLHPVVVIEGIIVGMPAHMANLNDGEILVGVSGNKVSSAKEAMKSLKWTKENKIEIQIERQEKHGEARDDLPVQKKSSEDVGNTSPKVTHSLNAAAQTSEASLKSGSSLTNNSRKTICKPACENPTWNQKFIFAVEPNLHYLNVCLWSKGGDYSGSSEVLKSAKHDVLVGYASLSLEDIYLHCLITLNGKLTDRVKLKHGHYKTEAELTKEWSVHKGWDPSQMYGDLSLALHFHPTQLTVQQRQELASCRAASGLKDLFGGSEDIEEVSEERSGGSHHGVRSGVNGEIRKRDQSAVGVDGKGRIISSGSKSDNMDQYEGHHQFDSTTFITATFCDYCGRKIWMKDAFKCRTCSMVCHKKCLVKCLVNTVCTTSGVRKRDAEDEAWQPLQTYGRPAANTVKVDPDSKVKLEQQGQVDDEDVDMPHEEITMSADHASMNSLSSLLDSFYTLNHEPNSPAKVRTAESSPEVGHHSRFRILREQTDRMKENVLRHLRRTKTSTTLSEKAIASAKQVGAQLFVDMDPLLRKDKLEEMVRKTHEQLTLEMKNKEFLEQQLSHLETDIISDDQGQGQSHRETKTVQQKLVKSGEKVDSMTLLMLQYCSGLQNCIHSLEGGDELDSHKEGSARNSRSASPVDGGNSVVYEVPSFGTPASGLLDSDSPKTERRRATFVGVSQGVGGFVRRVNSSMKEKMSSFKDFGRKGVGKVSSPSKSTSVASNDSSPKLDVSSERNNSGLVGQELVVMDVDMSAVPRTGRSKSDGQVEDLVRLVETPSLMTNSAASAIRFFKSPKTEDVSTAGVVGENVKSRNGSASQETSFSHPKIQIQIDKVESPTADLPPERQVSLQENGESGSPGASLRDVRKRVSHILRSRSDSDLDLRMGNDSDTNEVSEGSTKMRSNNLNTRIGRHRHLHPRDILTYRGSPSSLPQLFGHDDSDSDSSEYIVVESSEEDIPSSRQSEDSSDYDDDEEEEDDEDDNNDKDGEKEKDIVRDGVADVTFEGDPRVVAPGVVLSATDDDDVVMEHRTIVQQLQTYQ